MDRKFSLLIGVDCYQYLDDLTCARNDAQAFGKAIRKYWGFSADEVVTTSDDATLDDILDQLDKVREQGDLTYFLFWFLGALRRCERFASLSLP